MTNAPVPQCQPSQEPARHTATPWEHREGILHEAGNRWKCLPINSPYVEGAFEVGCDGHDIAEANAAFIVEAVNSHASLKADNEQLRKALVTEREEIAEKARRWAAFYGPNSDGRNTFVMFAEWVESRAALPQSFTVARG